MPLLPFVNRAAWIWSAEASHAVPGAELRSPSHYQVRMFRRRFDVRAGAQLQVHVSADSRFVFYCNGELVGRGPAKGDVWHQFYDSYDLTGRLRPGENVLAALVLDMSRVAHRPTHLGAPCSVMTYTGGFLLEGTLLAADGAELERLDTGAAGWHVRSDRAHQFQNENTRFEGYLGYFEHRVGREIPPGWTKPGFNGDDAWAPATTLYVAERLENRRDPTSPYGLLPRMIPALTEGAVETFRDGYCEGGAELEPEWRALLEAGTAVVLPAGSTRRIVLDAGYETTGFPHLSLTAGADAAVRLTYAEALRLPWDTPGARLLGRRQSLANLASHFADESTGWTFDRRGVLSGWSDRWEPAGSEVEQFEPLHWRTFRYIAVDLSAGSAPLTVHRLGYRYCAYPAEVTAEFECSDERLNAIAAAAVRTMRLCAHETFEDCPYYEQMQYAGDTMITSKLLMLTTGDYRLTRQALFHFDWSRLPEGLTQSRYPSRLLQVIPSWSLHWITAVRDYLYCSGDAKSTAELLPGMVAVLDWFHRHSEADGLPARLPFWNITDWCAWWPRGVVPGADSGPTCIIAAQYIQALDEVADICRQLGQSNRAGQFEAQANALRGALRTRFWSEAEGLFFDRPGGPEVSQYGNAWAVACGAATPADVQRLLRRFPSDPALAPGSFFCWHTVFRALEKGGAYDRMPEFLGPWHEMIDQGLSTFVEENSYWRSLCHAWSAHPLIEFYTRILGVQPLAPGFSSIRVAPHRCGLRHARGRVCTARGAVTVEWQAEGTRFRIRGEAPAATPVQLVLPNGQILEFSGGAFAAECA